jgi:hypothetical protein
VSDSFRLLMISAMYENGGNTTHRMLDGHPQLFVYPFESQIGTGLVRDHLASSFPVKYRWPVFSLDGTAQSDYRSIIDEEAKVRSRTPNVSKFRDHSFDLDDDERMHRYVELVKEIGRSRPGNVEAFFRSTFDVWNDFRRSGRERVHVGYSPIVAVDADKIFRDLPDAHVLHVVRNPWSAYADTKRRPVPLALPVYMYGWTLNQYYALLYRELHPGRFHIVRAEDVMADATRALFPVLDAMGLDSDDALTSPSFNGQSLDMVYPWGTIRAATTEANLATALELSEADRNEIRLRAWQYLEEFAYTDVLSEAV